MLGDFVDSLHGVLLFAKHGFPPLVKVVQVLQEIFLKPVPDHLVEGLAIKLNCYSLVQK